MFYFAVTRPRRRPSLTPMIDVVFLLLVFFMLAARFGQDFTLPLSTNGSDAPYEGAPRLIQLTTAGLTLNGAPVAPDQLTQQLAPLMPSPTSAIVIQPTGDAALQSMVDTIDILKAAGLTNVIVVPAP